jgi:hypothetical protein
MADRSLSRPRPEGAAKSPPAVSAGAPASVKAPAGVGAPAKATRAELALDRGRAAIVSLLACVVRARGRLSEADARTLCRHELPGKAFDLAQALAVDNGYLLALDGMCLVVTAAGRLLPGVMPPTARLVRMVEGASWEQNIKTMSRLLRSLSRSEKCTVLRTMRRSSPSQQQCGV